MDYQLVVIRGRSASTAVKLADGTTTAGRGEDCGLRIRSSQVSRKHCELFEKHGMLLVKDLASANGTFVNGAKVDGQRVMEPGDELGIGPIVFRVEKIGQPAPARPAAGPVKSSDTAIAEAVAGNDGGAEDEFEIDFDDEPSPSAPAPAVKAQATALVADDALELDDDAIAEAALFDDAPALTPATKAPPAVKAPPAERTPSPGLAASTKPSPPKKAPESPPAKEEPALADDAVADFLMGIKLDDDD